MWSLIFSRYHGGVWNKEGGGGRHRKREKGRRERGGDRSEITAIAVLHAIWFETTELDKQNLVSNGVSPSSGVAMLTTVYLHNYTQQ